MAKESEEGLSLSPREMEVLAIAWQCFETEPKIDMKKLARLTGYTPGSASVTLGKIKRKLKDSSDATPSATLRKSTAGTNRTPKSGDKRSAPMNADVDSKLPTPSKKKKSPSKKTAHHHDSDDDEEFANVRVKSEEAAALMEGANSFYEQQTAHTYGAGIFDYNDFGGFPMFQHPDALDGESA